MKSTPSLAPVLLLIAACSNSGSDSSVSDSANEDAARAESSRPVHGYEQALERVRDVNQDILDAAQRQREQIEKQEGGA